MEARIETALASDEAPGGRASAHSTRQNALGLVKAAGAVLAVVTALMTILGAVFGAVDATWIGAHWETVLHVLGRTLGGLIVLMGLCVMFSVIPDVSMDTGVPKFSLEHFSRPWGQRLSEGLIYGPFGIAFGVVLLKWPQAADLALVLMIVGTIVASIPFAFLAYARWRHGTTTCFSQRCAQKIPANAHKCYFCEETTFAGLLAELSDEEPAPDEQSAERPSNVSSSAAIAFSYVNSACTYPARPAPPPDESPQA